MLCHLSNERLVILSCSADSSLALKVQSSFFSLFLSLTSTRNPHRSFMPSSGLPGRWAQLGTTAALALWGGMGAGQTAQSARLGKHLSLLAWKGILFHVLGQVEMPPSLYLAAFPGDVQSLGAEVSWVDVDACVDELSPSYLVDRISEILLTNIVNFGKPVLQFQGAADSTS